MALANYTDLKTAVTNWMAKSSLSGQAADFITLAEAALNRELNPVESDTTLTGTNGSRTISISAYSVVEPIALFLAETGRDEVELTKKQDGTFPYSVISGRPRYWSIDGTNIDFDCPLSGAYPFRFRARTRFALSDAAPTNWLLTNHPDVYLAATLLWSGLYTRNNPIMQNFAAILTEGIPQVRNIIAQSNRGVLTVDIALQRIGRRSYYDGTHDLP
jgi:hypothetical protein